MQIAFCKWEISSLYIQDEKIKIFCIINKNEMMLSHFQFMAGKLRHLLSKAFKNNS